MANNDLEFSLDDILAEFHELENDSSFSYKSEPVSKPVEPVRESKPTREVERERDFEPAVYEKPAEQPDYRARAEAIKEKERKMSPEEKLESYKRAQAARKSSAENNYSERRSAREMADEFEQRYVPKQKSVKQFREEPAERKITPKKRNGKTMLISACAYALLLIWGVFNVHPGASLPKPSPSPVVPAPVVTQTPVEQPGTETDGQTDTENSDVVSEQPAEPAKPRYTIAEGSVLAPKANPDNFGSVPVANAAEIDAVIQQARDSGLLREDEEMIFDSSLAFNTGSYYQDIKYYCDETMLAIAWKQIVDGNTVTCMEVKVADGSQFRRKITGDTYGSPVDYLSNLNKATNAVVSMNADFYQFRDYGVMVYDGILYKCTDKRYIVHNGVDYKWYNCLDNCFITRDGDMIFTYFGEEFTWESMQQFVNDNNISFSLSFGPILVDNYEAQTHFADWYPVGEVDQGYSRAGFGQFDERHYLYMSLNHSDEKSARWTMMEFAQFFQTRGVEKAYAFDGGQTSEIIFNGEIYNHIDKSSERWVSDMVYFGTAIPEEVWNNG